MARIQKLLVANRGEIAIRVFRSAHELGIRTVAIYSHEDRFAMHRLKADEAYQIGQAGEPIKSYLNIPAIVALAVEKGVDAIHPGYGFLSENADFARACIEAGIEWVGPKPTTLDQLGDKVAARNLAIAAGVPILSGSGEPVVAGTVAHALAEDLGYPTGTATSFTFTNAIARFNAAIRRSSKSPPPTISIRSCAPISATRRSRSVST